MRAERQAQRHADRQPRRRRHHSRDRPPTLALRLPAPERCELTARAQGQAEAQREGPCPHNRMTGQPESNSAQTHLRATIAMHSKCMHFISRNPRANIVRGRYRRR